MIPGLSSTIEVMERVLPRVRSRGRPFGWVHTRERQGRGVEWCLPYLTQSVQEHVDQNTPQSLHKYITHSVQEHLDQNTSPVST